MNAFVITLFAYFNEHGNTENKFLFFQLPGQISSYYTSEYIIQHIVRARGFAYSHLGLRAINELISYNRNYYCRPDLDVHRKAKSLSSARMPQIRLQRRYNHRFRGTSNSSLIYKL